MAKWEMLFAQESGDRQTGLCLIPNELPENAQLQQMGRRYFEDRCFIDPDDRSEETMGIIAQDLLRTFQQRGSYTEWIPYELWTSSNSRRHAEGLKKEMQARGFNYAPQGLRHSQGHPRARAGEPRLSGQRSAPQSARANGECSLRAMVVRLWSS